MSRNRSHDGLVHEVDFGLRPLSSQKEPEKETLGQDPWWTECADARCTVKLPLPLPKAEERENPDLCIRHWMAKSAQQRVGAAPILYCVRAGGAEHVPFYLAERSIHLCVQHREELGKDLEEWIPGLRQAGDE